MKIILFIVAVVLAIVAYNQFKSTDASLSVWERIKAAAVSAFSSVGAAVAGWFS
jgi:uncharacterized membrane protein